MALKVWICADTIGFPNAGGHCWAYLNWALGLKALGCEVTWLETLAPRLDPAKARMLFAALRKNLEIYGVGDRIAVAGGQSLTAAVDLEEAEEADLLVNLKYGVSEETVRRFRRSALVDIDPGLLQIWMHSGQVRVAPHDLYFTIGETVGTPEAAFPDAGLRWLYTPPCVAIDWWQVTTAPSDATFRTVSNWYGGDWVVSDGEMYDNNKRTGFLPFLDLPRRTSEHLELALCLSAEEEDKKELESLGWTVRHAEQVTPSPEAYRAYIQGAKGEFSCAKPSCIRLQNAWISDRTLCFLASGKPAIVEYTGPSRFLPEAAGLLRFRDIEEAVRYLDLAASDYEYHSKEARALVEQWFDSSKVVRSVLQRALT